MDAEGNTLRGGAETEAAPRVFYNSFLEFLRDLPGTAKRFWVLVILTGVSSGLGAALLIKILRVVQSLAWRSRGENFLAAVQSATAGRRLLVTASAGVLVTVVSLIARQPLRGHGTAGVIESIWVRSGKFPMARSLLRGLVSIVAVGLGAPLGREGALIQTGAATGSWLGSKFRIPADQSRLLVACGAAAGIAAAYNVPIGAAVFGLEVLLGSFALELFGPIVVCCVVATLISRILLADHPSYIIPHYKLTGPAELLMFLGIGPILGVASALYIRGIDAFSALDRAPKRWAPYLPTGAMVVVAVVALWLPEILGNGYDTVNIELVSGLPLLLAVVLPLVKLGATGLAAGAGVPGGLFTPSLFFGALIGGALGHLAHLIFPHAAPPGAYALVGMAAVLAGTTNAPVSAVLIIFELTGDYDAILPLMLTCVLSATVCRRIEPHSLYTSVLHARNVQLPETPRPQWLKATKARALTAPNPEKVSPETPLEEVLLRLLALPTGHDVYVVAGDGRYVGVLRLDELKGHIPDHSLLKGAVASDVMDTQIKPVKAEMSLSEVALRFADTALERLPVVEGRSGKLIGTVSKSDVLRRGRF